VIEINTDRAEDVATSTATPAGDASSDPVLGGATWAPLLAHRFHLVRKIGAGGMGAVYEACDRQRADLHVAVKLPHRTCAEGIYGLKREFRLLSEIRHPNLVALYDLVCVDGAWCYSMELVDGLPFHEALDLTPRALRFARFLDALEQLTSGIEALHRAGRVHRDLKPRNILVTPQGRVVIVDFGLTALTEAGFAGHHSVPMGATPRYAAPEHLRGDPPRPANDWYAVGVLVQEALATWLGGHGVTPHIVKLVERWLEPDPEARGSARDFRTALAELRAEDSGDPSSAPSPDSPARGVEPPSPFVGRSREIDRLRRAFAEAARGAPQAVVIEGESGIGKTRLAVEFLKELDRYEAVFVFRGHCHVHEAIPYNAFDGIADGMATWLRDAPPLRAAAALPRDARSLAQLFPVFHRASVMSDMPPRAGPEPDAAALQRRAFDAFVALLTRISDRHPVVLFIDDLQWRDADSERLLSHILSRSLSMPLLLLATSRPSPESFAPAWQQIALGPLEPAEAMDLVRALAGDRRPATPELERRVRETGGIPIFVRELVRGDAGASGGLPSFDAALSRRIDELSADARQVLELVCVAGHPLPIDVAASLVPSLTPPLLSGLVAAALIREGLESGRGVLEPYHDRVRELVAARLSESARSDVHLRLGKALRARDLPSLHRAVDHYLRAGHRAEAARVAADAARHAGSVLAYGSAIELLRVALEPVTDRDRRLALLRELAVICENAGRCEDAAREFEAVAALETEPAAIHASRRRAMTNYLAAGARESGVRLLRQLWHETGARLPRSGFLLFLSILWLMVLESLTSRRAKPRPSGPSAPHLRARLDMARAVFHSGSLSATLVSVYCGAVAVRLAERLGQRAEVLEVRAFRAVFLSTFRGIRDTKTEELLERSQRELSAIRATEAPALWPPSSLLLAQATYFLYTTSLDETLELCLPLTVRDEEATARARAVAQMASLPALYLTGRIARLNELSERCLRDARQRGDRVEEVNALVYGVFRDLARDDGAGARARLARARAVPLDFVHAALGDPWWESSVALYAGDARAAFDRHFLPASEYWARLYPAASHRVLYWLSFGNAASAMIAGATDRRRFFAVLERSIRRVGRDRARLAKPAFCQLRAQLAYHRGQRERASVLLAEAALEYDALGARLHAAAARLARASLVDGPAAEQLRLRATQVFETERIANPARWTSMLIAGLSPNDAPERGPAAAPRELFLDDQKTA
jgi:serine/threonine protein kinase